MNNNPAIVLGAYRPDLLHDETLADIFRVSAKKYASNTALIFGDRSVTYEQLDRWSDAMADHLYQNGIGPGDPVGIWWPRGIELHVAILGIIKAGASYVPLDHEMPAERVETVLQEVGARGYISQDKLSVDCPVFKVIAAPKADELVYITRGATPDNWAYV